MQLSILEIQIILGDYYNPEDIEWSFLDVLSNFKHEKYTDISKCISYYKMSIDKFKNPILMEKYRGRVYDVFNKKYIEVE